MTTTQRNEACKVLAPIVIAWQREHGRHHLPWQQDFDPYRIWVSEIMLQQTQVETVIGYYQRFMEAFPDVQSLAAAPLDAVLHLWAGLGYYARARNLHACARQIVEKWQGQFPIQSTDLETLPGIGRSTAGAIAAFCFGGRAAILDGNVRRVFCRYFGIDQDPLASATQKELWSLAEQALPASQPASTLPARMRSYTQGLMDLGATVCKRNRPDCDKCPLRQDCNALHTQRVDELPVRRRRVTRGQRKLHLLIVTDGQRILLQKRPTDGIWGGLWSLPQVTSKKEVLHKQRWTLEDKPLAMAVRHHDLTHLRLFLHPWLLTVVSSDTPTGLSAEDQTHGNETEEVWVTRDNWQAYGVPKPIRDILEGYWSAQ